MIISMKRAEEVVDVAVKKAESMGIHVIAAVVDDHGKLIVLKRMDDAPWGSIDVAINKAYTAAAWKTPTKDLFESCNPDGPFFSIHFSNEMKMITFGGGIPLGKDVIYGAIGVSGGTEEQDQICAQTAAEFFDIQ